VNEIIQTASKEKVTRDDLSFCLGHLLNHALYHFESEEKYLLESKYPDAKEHLEAHVRYREEMKNFLVHVGDKNIEVKQLSDEVAAFAGDWLNRHMLGIDKERLQFLKNSGKSSV
jgi:hemerythrin-like metal-binding protein